MRKVQIGFSLPKNHPFPLFSWLIRWAEAKKFWGYNNASHAYVRWHSSRLDAWNSYEASGFTLHFLGDKAFRKHITPMEVYEVEVPDEKFEDALSYCVKHAGLSYSLIGALSLAWPYLKTKFSGKYVESKYNDGEESQYCSEVTGRFLKAAGIDFGVNYESLGVHRLRLLMRDLDSDSELVTRIL